MSIRFSIAKDRKSEIGVKFLIGHHVVRTEGPWFNRIKLLVVGVERLMTSRTNTKHMKLDDVDVRALEGLGRTLIQAVELWREEQRKVWGK